MYCKKQIKIGLFVEGNVHIEYSQFLIFEPNKCIFDIYMSSFDRLHFVSTQNDTDLIFFVDSIVMVYVSIFANKFHYAEPR